MSMPSESFVVAADAEAETRDDSWLEILEDRDPLDVLAETPVSVAEIVAGADDDALRARPKPGEWSVEELIGHLADAEAAFAVRWRLILTRDHPRYPGLEAEGQVALPKPPLTDMLRLFSGLRGYNLWLLRNIPVADWERVGVHEEDGVETVEFNTRKLAAHDLDHIAQIKRILASAS